MKREGWSVERIASPSSGGWRCEGIYSNHRIFGGPDGYMAGLSPYAHPHLVQCFFDVAISAPHERHCIRPSRHWLASRLLHAFHRGQSQCTQFWLHMGITIKFRHKNDLLHRGHGKLWKRMLAAHVASIQINATAIIDQLFSKIAFSKEPKTNVPGMYVSPTIQSMVRRCR